MDISPDGSYFVVGTSGAFGGTVAAVRHAPARWETFATGTGLQPSWIDFTGGDSLYSVEVAGTAVYVGGHQRWENNPFGHDSLGQGGVVAGGHRARSTRSTACRCPGTRAGPAAAACFDFLATADGLWVGSDTDRIGGGRVPRPDRVLPARWRHPPCRNRARRRFRWTFTCWGQR